MKSLRIFLGIAFLFHTLYILGADHLRLLPQPQQCVLAKGYFVVGKMQLSTPVLSLEWKQFVTEMGGTLTDQSASSINIKLVDAIDNVPVNQDEAYRLTITPKAITVEAVAERGVYWAMQTLYQLKEEKGKKIRLQCGTITDWPAFRIRGFMQDVGRSYLSLEELKREIAILSRFKINTFHWHLTENQAWRLESKIFPMLNDSANMTRMAGKYYTLEEARELTMFCKAHQVLLIPEIDMPGHSAAFIRTFRHDMQSPEGMKILKLLLDEICETFDVPYLHIGTDEVHFTNPQFVPEWWLISVIKGKK